MEYNNDYVSFTRTVKEEVTLVDCENRDEKRALLSGFIKINSNLIIRNNGWNISIRSENIKTAKLILKYLKEVYEIEPRVSFSEHKRFRKNSDAKVVHIEISTKSKYILEDLDIYDIQTGFEALPQDLLSNQDRIRQYLKGCFLASGSVNSPTTKNYHLEIGTEHVNHASYLVRLLKKFYIEAKIIERRNQYIVYVKKSEKIADFLKIIGANDSLFYFEDVRIQRDQLNSMNRIINCEVSNERKAIEIGNKQADIIRWYKDNFSFKNLDSKLKVIAEVRLANPDATYEELCEDCKDMFGLMITKSGVSYRMSKLISKLSSIKGEEHG